MFGFAGAKASSGNCSRDNKRQINTFYQNSSCPFDHSTPCKGLSEAFCAQLTFWSSELDYSCEQAASDTGDQKQAFEWVAFRTSQNSSAVYGSSHAHQFALAWTKECVCVFSVWSAFASVSLTCIWWLERLDFLQVYTVPSRGLGWYRVYLKFINLTTNQTANEQRDPRSRNHCSLDLGVPFKWLNEFDANLLLMLAFDRQLEIFSEAV